MALLLFKIGGILLLISSLGNKKMMFPFILGWFLPFLPPNKIINIERGRCSQTEQGAMLVAGKDQSLRSQLFPPPVLANYPFSLLFIPVSL